VFFFFEDKEYHVANNENNKPVFSPQQLNMIGLGKGIIRGNQIRQSQTLRSIAVDQSQQWPPIWVDRVEAILI